MSFEQIDFLNNFVRFYGFKSISDYDSLIKMSSINNIDNINNVMTDIKKLFKLSGLNLSRKKYIIDSPNLAFCLLKNLLQQTNVPFDIIHKNDGNYVRLVPQNNILMNYINQHMINIIHNNINQNQDVKQTVNFNELYSSFKLENCYSKKPLEFLVTRLNCDGCISKKDDVQNINFIEIYDDKITINIFKSRDCDIIKDINVELLTFCIGESYVSNKIDNSKISTCCDNYIYDNNIIPLLCTPYNDFIIKIDLNKSDINKINSNNKILLEHNQIYLDQLPRNKLRNHIIKLNNGKISNGNFVGDNFYNVSNKLLIVNNSVSLPHYYQYFENIQLYTIDNDFNVIDNNISFIKIEIGKYTVYTHKNNSNNKVIMLNDVKIPIKYLKYNDVKISISNFENSDSHTILQFDHKKIDIENPTCFGRKIVDGSLI